MRSVFSFLVVVSIGCAALHAGEAVFSADGSKVYQLGDGAGPTLDEVDLKSGRLVHHSFAKDFGKEEITGLSRSSSGFILLSTPTAAWAWDAAKNSVNKMCAAPAGSVFQDIAYDPKNKWTLLTTYTERPAADERRFNVLLMRKDDVKPSEVFVRRVDVVEGPVFDADGTLIFGTHGDIWLGQIRWDETRGILEATRYCPIATLETGEGTPSQTGARDFAHASGMIYAHVRRMGGSGWGDIVRLKAPVASRSTDGELAMEMDVDKRAAMSVRALSSIEKLADGGSRSYLCASGDGKIVHYTTKTEKGRVHWLVRNNGRPEECKVGQ